jgi:HSP90 family molecular chaperone
MDLMSSGSQGIVDSDTLPLNVSREMLQQHSSLKTITKKLIRKALDMIKRIVDDDPAEIISEDEGVHSTLIARHLSRFQAWS